MKEPNLISSSDSDDGFIDTNSENFHEENDALLPRSYVQKLSEASKSQENIESSIQFRIGRKKRLKVGTMSHPCTLLSYAKESCFIVFNASDFYSNTR